MYTAADLQLCNLVHLEVPFRYSCTFVHVQSYICISTTRVINAYKVSLDLYLDKQGRSIKSGLFIFPSKAKSSSIRDFLAAKHSMPRILNFSINLKNFSVAPRIDTVRW